MTANRQKNPAGETKSRPPHASVSWRPMLWVGTLAGLAVFLVAAVIALVSQYQRTLSLERAATAREAATVIGAVEAGIDVHVRPGAQYSEGKLQEYLDRLIETSPAMAIALVTKKDERIMAAGDVDLLDGEAHWAEARINAVWSPHQGRARFHRSINPPHGPGYGGRGPRGKEQWSAFPTDSFRVAVVMDVEDLTERIAAARIRLMASLAGLVIVVLLGGLTLSLSVRRRKLELDLERAEELVAQQERLTRLGAGLAHETRNPLAVVRGFMQSIASDASSSESIRQTTRDAIDEVDRTVGRINSFLQLARPVDPQPSPVDLSKLFEEVTRLLTSEAMSGVSLQFECKEPELRVMADLDMLRRALFNLALNSLRAIGPEGQVRFEAEKLSDGLLEIRVIDDGQGISAEDMPHVKEPYFTRSPGGSGLGLAIVEKIAKAHGWALDIESVPGAGTRVSFRGLTPVR